MCGPQHVFDDLARGLYTKSEAVLRYPQTGESISILRDSSNSKSIQHNTRLANSSGILAVQSSDNNTAGSLHGFASRGVLIVILACEDSAWISQHGVFLSTGSPTRIPLGFAIWQIVLNMAQHIHSWTGENETLKMKVHGATLSRSSPAWKFTSGAIVFSSREPR